MLVLQSPQIVQETVLQWKREGKIAFVPTMGCLHAGHLSLIEKARALGHRTVASIFVNPLQFAQGEDLEKYPRPFESDVDKLEQCGVDLLFAPTERDLYPAGFCSRVRVDGLTSHLCGASRPGHFEGVATVCLKLFQITQADFAIFGQKDFQQLRVLQQMVADFNLALTLVPAPTVREADGLALSSRNQYLTQADRSRASLIPKAWQAAAAIAESGSAPTVGQALAAAQQILAQASLEVDYLQIAPEATLLPASPETPLSTLNAPRLFLAVRLGSTRLIDNTPLYRATRVGA